MWVSAESLRIDAGERLEGVGFDVFEDGGVEASECLVLSEVPSGGASFGVVVEEELEEWWWEEV